MSSPALAIQLSEAEMRLLQTLVYQECGMYFDARRAHFLQDRLQRRLRECRMDSFYAYYRLLMSAAGKEELIKLVENPDILATLAQSARRPRLVIGFAAETENLLENARAKLAKKRVDAIVLNDVSRTDIGFNSDRNEVTIITPSETIAVPEASKLEIAQKILAAALRLRQQQPTIPVSS